MTLNEPIPQEMRSIIMSRLEFVERNERVRLLFAVESGSRAWGFPSPDSDYDVRFVYVHEPEWYLSIDDRRDVIELPIDGDLDINGWDFRKALKLLLKPNPVLLEWIRSPIVYQADQAAMQKIAVLGEKVAHQRPSVHHYLHLAESQYRRFIAEETRVPLKKYFYSLRPALALMWLRMNPNAPVPMNLSELRNGISLPSDVSCFVDELLKKKAVTKELGDGVRHEGLDQMIENEILIARTVAATSAVDGQLLLDEANGLFRELVAM